MKPIEKDHPGVYIPPPGIYAVFFFAGLFAERRIPLGDALFQQHWVRISGIIFFLLAAFFLFSSLRQFFLGRTTMVTIKPASSLQTKGIYRISRNPMYVGLSLIYLGLTCFSGNGWNLILFPLLILVMQVYVIRREENYLGRRFGNEYIDYKARVRRWL